MMQSPESPRPETASMQSSFHKGEHLYFLPIGGTAMATLAGLLHQQGHRVEGVDTNLYPPMSTLLEDLEIPVRRGWNPDLIPASDRVIIGNAIPRTNPEIQRVLADRRPYLSQAEAVSQLPARRGTGKSGGRRNSRKDDDDINGNVDLRAARHRPNGPCRRPPQVEPTVLSSRSGTMDDHRR